MGVPFELGKSLHVFSLLKRFRQHFEREMSHWLYFLILLPTPVTGTAIRCPFSVRCCHTLPETAAGSGSALEASVLPIL